MLHAIFLALALILFAVESANWAVLIAGSNGYWNYRHQADVAHCYQILRNLGKFPEENIIVLMYDDVAHSDQNPFPGQLFNEPNGVNVYENLNISYSHLDVNTVTFLNVLKGNRSGATLHGPVLESTANDNVFIYYTDHGGNGMIAMPVGPPLYADELNEALKYMHEHQMFHQLVFYLEACESGSMFDGVLLNNISVFATTAATPDEPSYAFYYNATLNTYMADEYSIKWMQDSTKNWNSISHETLIQQYDDVVHTVKQSQPQKYGDESFDDEAIEDFEAFDAESRSNCDCKKTLILAPTNDNKQRQQQNWTNVGETMGVSARDVKLSILQKQYLNAKGAVAKLKTGLMVEKEILHRLDVDNRFDKLVRVIVRRNANVWRNGRNSFENVVDAIKSMHFRVTDYECLRLVYAKYEELCEKFDGYSLQYVNTVNS